jgi:hypothetical protein
MKIYVEKQPASRPERAWIKDNYLYVWYHLYDRTLFDYTDADATVSLSDIISADLRFGPRGGFKGITLKYNDNSGRIIEFNLSYNHREVINEMIKALEDNNIIVNKEIRKEVNK